MFGSDFNSIPVESVALSRTVVRCDTENCLDYGMENEIFNHGQPYCFQCNRPLEVVKVLEDDSEDQEQTLA